MLMTDYNRSNIQLSQTVPQHKLNYAHSKQVHKKNNNLLKLAQSIKVSYKFKDSNPGFRLLKWDSIVASI